MSKLLATLVAHTQKVKDAQFSPDNQRVVTASDDKTARVWEAQSGKLLFTLEGHQRVVLGAQFSPDSRRIVTASWDTTARVWEAQSGKLLATLQGHQGVVRSARFSGFFLQRPISARRPTTMPACGPPSSLSPENVTTSTPALTTSCTVGS